MKNKNCYTNYMEGRESEFKSIVKIINEGIDIFEKREEMGGKNKILSNNIALLNTMLFNISENQECLEITQIWDKEQDKCPEILWQLRHNKYTKYKSTLLKK